MKPDVIAITGYIGSGKSTVTSILRQWGYETVDCDALAREISDDGELTRQVADLLGEEYVTEGKLNRAAIRSRVFGDAQLLSKYQSLFFGKVRKRLDEIVSRAHGPLFVEIPVFSAFDYDWREVWTVYSPESDIISRVISRDSVDETDVRAILSRQSLPRPTRVIRNDGSVSHLKEALRAALVQAGL